MKVFHGGCLGCVNQAIKGIGYCDGCQYRRADWNLPNLYRDNEDLLELKKLYEDIFIKKNNSNQLEPPVMLQTAEELNKIIEAGNKLAEAAHRLQSEYDGVHRLRLALSEWYKVRANESNRDSSLST